MQDLEERLLRPCQPSEILRQDERFVGEGADAAVLASTREAVAALGLAIDGEPPPPSLKGRLLASIARPGRYGRFVDRLARLFQIDIAGAEHLAARLEDPEAFLPFLVEGVRVVPVEPGPGLEGAITLVVKLEPGTRFPDHVHGGAETMFVLEGGFREDGAEGREAWRGDEMVSVEGSGHTFVALPGGPCITASVVHGIIDWR